MTARQVEERDEVERLSNLVFTIRPDVNRLQLRCTLLAKTRNSRVYEISDAATLHWAAKVCVDPWTHALTPEAARIQFEALSSLRNRAQEAGVALSMPEPVHLDAGNALLVMSWLNGLSLTAQLCRWPRAAAALNERLWDTGRWLALLHSVGPVSADMLPTQRKLAGLSDVLRLETARDGVFRRGIELLTRFASKAAEQSHPWSWIHGDFKPDNVLFAEGGTAGIDIQLRDVSSVLEDVAPFLNNIEIHCAMPLAWRTRSQRQALVARFLEGYASVIGEVPPVPLAWMRLYSASSLWAYDMTVDRNPAKVLITDRLYRALVRRLSAVLEELGGATSSAR